MTALLERVIPGQDVHRGRVARLTIAHAGADLFQAAVPALIPFFVAERGMTYADAGLLVLAGSLASSVMQPLAGVVGDRVRAAWLQPLGLVLAGGGLLAATMLHSFAAIAVALLLGGLGVAIFHPEAFRATRAAAAASPGAALGVFALGGNIGFALGPSLVVPLGAAYGIEAAGAVAVIPLAGALLLGRGIDSELAEPEPDEPGAAPLPSDWRTFGFATLGATAAAGVLFGLMAFAPVWFDETLGAGVGLGSAAVTGMLLAGAVGTYAAGALGDRHGRRPVVLVSVLALVPLSAVLPLTGPLLAVVLLIVIGLVLEGIFYPLVIVAQDGLPRHAGLAAGMALGLSVGIAAGTTSLLGVLVDANGPVAALWGCAVMAAVALGAGALAVRRPH
ncbi:MFS transporter [Jiangella rhizosphaerae]|uniref:MFS transporter n=1 Tax=Jiangella rhizosphaerae TaxID=2293569 RepID=A0A418KQ28_9ACTN|nr:MFS transporter [Jiangella rhizosphaerae]RIQ21886.1 MFS transporter [Jiangella rhizosphaerae]